MAGRIVYVEGGRLKRALKIRNDKRRSVLECSIRRRDLRFRELWKANPLVRSGNQHECPMPIVDSLLSLIGGREELENRPQR